MKTTQILFYTLLVLCSFANAQFDYLPFPVSRWSSQVPPIVAGNGVFVSPDDSLVVSTSMDGTVVGFDPSSGTQLWSYRPPNVDGAPMTCKSGITFSYSSSVHYMIFSIIDDETSLYESRSRVVALSPTGEQLWISRQLEGVASGTPVVSSAGDYIFLTHNSLFDTVGHFTILRSQMEGLPILITRFDNVHPYAPPGIYFNPVEGYYPGGEGNTNDLVMWSYRTRPGATAVGVGAMFAFQFPINFSGSASGLNYVVVGSYNRVWQSASPPVLANEGRSLYWSVSRGQFRCWIGGQDNTGQFSGGNTGQRSFDRGDPNFISPFATLALSHNDHRPMLFGGGASTQFVKMNFDMTQAISVDTNSLVKNQARVSPDDLVVYYTEFNGRLNQAFTSNLSNRASVQLPAQVEGEFSITSDGAMIFIGDIAGNVLAYYAGDPPTHMPSTSPTLSPTSSPSQAPTLRPTPLPPPSLSPINPDNPAPTPTTGSASFEQSVVLSVTVMSIVVFFL